MAVYTHLEHREIVAILGQYDIHNMTAYKGIAQGVENSNYLIICSDKRYILTIYEERVAGDDLPFFIGLMQHLSGEGVECPVPLKTSNDEHIIDISGKNLATCS